MTEGSGFRVERLDRGHKRDFSCGVEELDRYFHQMASQDQRRRVAVPYVLVDTTLDSIAGYYTLSNLSIVLDDLPEETRRRLPRYPSVPAILIGRLAVDQRYQGQRLGEQLLLDALTRSLGASQQVAAMAVVVDAKDDPARRFYERYGYQRFLDHPYRLFLTMATIVQLVS